VNDRLKVKVGGPARVDFVHTDSDPRLITGNIDIFGPAAFPVVTQGPPPINRFCRRSAQVYSSNPTNGKP